MATTPPIPTADDIKAMTPRQYKALENRLRAAATRQGLRLEKSRVRDRRAIGFGTYHLADIATSALAVWGLEGSYGLDLADVAEALYGEDDES